MLSSAFYSPCCDTSFLSGNHKTFLVMGYSFSQCPAFNPFSFSVRTNLLNRHFMVEPLFAGNAA
jgi:hypothetical protein